MHWITDNPFENGTAKNQNLRIAFKNRHTPIFSDGEVAYNREDNEYVIKSDTDIQGIAPGQYVILYSPDRKRCLGSGMITLPSAKGKRRKARHEADAKEQRL